jgi:DNA-binding transcriptional regulator YdaS (Cro superfamily)
MSTEKIMDACRSAGGQAALARLIGASPAFVYQWTTGRRPVPAEFCPKIERATQGQVRCEDLRPDIEWSVLRHPCDCDSKEAA